MRHLRTSALLVLIGLQACVSPYEKTACATLMGYPQLAAPPADVASLYLFPTFGAPRPGYHEHWYKLSDNRLAACRHIKKDHSGCATEVTRFVRSRGGWELDGPGEVIICASDASQPLPSSVTSLGVTR